MTTQVVLFVEFAFPGIFLVETSSKRMERTDDIVLPKGAVGYRTYSRTITVVDGEELKGEPRDYSGWTYFGREMTLADVERDFPEKKILISNMRGGYDRVVMTNRGTAYPLNSADRVIA